MILEPTRRAPTRWSWGKLALGSARFRRPHTTNPCFWTSFSSNNPRQKKEVDAHFLAYLRQAQAWQVWEHHINYKYNIRATLYCLISVWYQVCPFAVNPVYSVASFTTDEVRRSQGLGWADLQMRWSQRWRDQGTKKCVVGSVFSYHFLRILEEPYRSLICCFRMYHSHKGPYYTPIWSFHIWKISHFRCEVIEPASWSHGSMKWTGRGYLLLGDEPTPMNEKPTNQRFFWILWDGTIGNGSRFCSTMRSMSIGISTSQSHRYITCGSIWMFQPLDASHRHDHLQQVLGQSHRSHHPLCGRDRRKGEGPRGPWDFLGQWAGLSGRKKRWKDVMKCD